MQDRKPAKRRSEVGQDVLDALHKGTIESKNLVEWLCIDRVRLVGFLASSFSQAESKKTHQLLQSEIGTTINGLSPLKQSFALGALLVQTFGLKSTVFTVLTSHTSDVAREISAVMIGDGEHLTFARRLAWIKPLADDPNPGVREVAWMALRKHVQLDLVGSIRSLVPWTGSRNERLRRYASELTRPRGVWCTHLEELKSNLDLGLPILDPLCADESDYVQKSVANWINDASKTDPGWAIRLTKRWKKQSDTVATEKIVRRALRTIRKKEELDP